MEHKHATNQNKTNGGFLKKIWESIKKVWIFFELSELSIATNIFGLIMGAILLLCIIKIPRESIEDPYLILSNLLSAYFITLPFFRMLIIASQAFEKEKEKKYEEIRSASHIRKHYLKVMFLCVSTVVVVSFPLWVFMQMGISSFGRIFLMTLVSLTALYWIICLLIALETEIKEEQLCIKFSNKGIEEKINFKRKDFNQKQWDQIKKGIKEDIEIKEYANPKFSPEEMEQLRLAKKEGIDIGFLVRGDFSSEIMPLIRLSVELGRDVSIFKKHEFVKLAKQQKDNPKNQKILRDLVIMAGVVLD